jgi:NitT/TauT family transport system ATP-binding protein
MTQPILVAEHLQMTFTSPDAPLEALAEADFQLWPNEFVTIIGPSGCGKSTLLRILAGLVRPTAGRVILDGASLERPQRSVGFVFQHPTLMPWRSALRNVMLPLEIAGAARDEAERRARDLLGLVGLEEFAEAYPRELSGGMQQRVALARALVYDPELLLLDEPFGALDALTRERLNWELLRIWRARRKTVLMVTHNIQEAVFLSDRVLTMSPRPGRIEGEVDIDLPRPREQQVLYAPRFLELTRILRDSLR